MSTMIHVKAQIPPPKASVETVATIAGIAKSKPLNTRSPVFLQLLLIVTGHWNEYRAGGDRFLPVSGVLPPIEKFPEEHPSGAESPRLFARLFGTIEAVPFRKTTRRERIAPIKKRPLGEHFVFLRLRLAGFCGSCRRVRFAGFRCGNRSLPARFVDPQANNPPDQHQHIDGAVCVQQLFLQVHQVFVFGT